MRVCEVDKQVKFEMNMWFKRDVKASAAHGVKALENGIAGRIRRRKAAVHASARDAGEKETRRHSDIMDVKASLERRESDESLYESADGHSDAISAGDDTLPRTNLFASKESIKLATTEEEEETEFKNKKGHRKALSLSTPLEIVKSLGDEWQATLQEAKDKNSDKKKSRDSLWSEEEKDCIYGSNVKIYERRNSKKDDKKKTSMEPPKSTKRVSSVSALNFLRRKRKTVDPVKEDRITSTREIITATALLLEAEVRYSCECESKLIIQPDGGEKSEEEDDVDAEDEESEEQTPKQSLATPSKRRVSRTISRSKSKSRGKSQTVKVNTLRKSQSGTLKRAKKKKVKAAAAANRSRNASVADAAAPDAKLAETKSSHYWPFNSSVKGDARREAGATDASSQDADCAQEAAHDKEDHKDGILWRPAAAAAAGGKPVNRAESCREPAAAAARRGKQRNASDPNRLTANKQHDCEGGGGGGGGAASGSSSSSSLSTCSAESAPAPDPRAASQSDFSEEEEPLAEAWSATVAPELVESLCARLRKRQELAHELITSESSHVRWLKVLHVVFLRPLEREAPGLLPPEEVRALFPNLPAVRERHARLYADLRALRKHDPIVQIGPLADAVINTLGDPSYAKVLSKFCCGQRMALDALRERRRKSKELHQYLSGKEQDQLCGRLQLRDLMAVVWQRLTKYQLLLEGVLGTVRDSDCEEAPEPPERGDAVARLRRALDTAKDVLHRVDTAVRTAENEHRMRSIQSKLEVRGAELELDLTQHALLFEGTLAIRTDSKKTAVLALMTPEFLVLLQREGDKFLLKPMGQLTPIIKWSTVLFRPNAAVRNTFFLMNINCLQMYELSANNLTEYNTWTKYISEMPLAEGRAVRAPSVAHSRERTDDSSGGGVSRNASDASRTSASSITLEDVTDPDKPAADPDKSTADPDKPAADPDKSAADLDIPAAEQEEAGDAERPVDAADTTGSQNDEVVEKTAAGAAQRRPALTTTGRITTHEFDPPPLAAAVHAETIATTLVATNVLSSEERLRRLDEEIARAMRAKSALVGELLGVPGEDLALVEDLAVEEALGPRAGADLHQLLLAAQAQANQITLQLQRALQASDADVLAARHAGAGVGAGAGRRRGDGLCDRCGARRPGRRRGSAEPLGAALTETAPGPPAPALSALDKELSYDMLSDLDAPEAPCPPPPPPPASAAPRELAGVLLEEIGESSTDPLTPPIGGVADGVADACLAARLVPLASGLQSALATLLHAAPAADSERRRLRRELAALRDQCSALRHAQAVSHRAARVEASPSPTEADATQSHPAETSDAAAC